MNFEVSKGGTGGAGAAEQEVGAAPAQARRRFQGTVQGKGVYCITVCIMHKYSTIHLQ